jgi:hypothetical protein
MTQNIGTIDRTLRLVVGVLLIAFAIPIGFPATGWNWVGWIGIIPPRHGPVCHLPALRRAWPVHVSRRRAIRGDIRCTQAAGLLT